MNEAIVITGKGGAGKTTVCACLGAALAVRGQRVLLVDASLGLRGLDLPLRLENEVLNTLSDLLAERCTREEVILPVPGVSGLYLLPAPQSKKPFDIGLVEMKILIRNLKKDFGWILIDAPSGIERGFLVAAAGADRGLIVLPSDRAGTRAASRFNSLLQEEGIRDSALLFNRLLPLGNADPIPPEESAELLGLPVLGAVPECRELAFLDENGGVFKEKSTPASRAFLDAADRLLGMDRPLIYPTVESKKKNSLSRFFGI